MINKIFFPVYEWWPLISLKKFFVIEREEVHLHREGSGEASEVDQSQRGGRHDEADLQGDEGEPSEAAGGSASSEGREAGPRRRGQMGEARYEAAKIRVTITARRIRIDPEESRSRYIKRLEHLIEQLDEVIANKKSSQKLKLRAMDILIRAVKACYGIVSDIEVERLEGEFEEAQEEEKREGQGTDLGYDIEESPAQ